MFEAFPGGMSDPTDRDAIHTAEREAFEEIGLEPHHYSIVGRLLPLTDSRLVIITPVIALLHSPKFVDFRLSIDEATDAFYVDLEQFLFKNENYDMKEVGDDFITHHFQVDQYHIWGVTAYALILVATFIFQRLPQFPVYRHDRYLEMSKLLEQQMDFFRFCVDYQNRVKHSHDKEKEKSSL